MSADLPTEADFVAVTTGSKRKRHWCLKRDMRDSRVTAGQMGWALCGGYNSADQERLNDLMPRGWRKLVVIAYLPPCKQCDKSKQRRIDGRPS